MPGHPPPDEAPSQRFCPEMYSCGGALPLGHVASGYKPSLGRGARAHSSRRSMRITMHDRHTPHNNTHNNAHIGHDSHRELQTKLAMRLMAGIHNSVSWRPAPYSGASGCLTLSTPFLLYQQDKPQIHNANEQQILVARPSPHALTQSLYMLLMPSNHITKPSMA